MVSNTLQGTITYPTWGKGKSSTQKCRWGLGICMDMLVSWRVCFFFTLKIGEMIQFHLRIFSRWVAKNHQLELERPIFSNGTTHQVPGFRAEDLSHVNSENLLTWHEPWVILLGSGAGDPKKIHGWNEIHPPNFLQRKNPWKMMVGRRLPFSFWELVYFQGRWLLNFLGCNPYSAW